MKPTINVNRKEFDRMEWQRFRLNVGRYLGHWPGEKELTDLMVEACKEWSDRQEEKERNKSIVSEFED